MKIIGGIIALLVFLFIIWPGWALGNPIWDEFGGGDAKAQVIYVCPDGRQVSNLADCNRGAIVPAQPQVPLQQVPQQATTGCPDTGTTQAAIGLNVVRLGSEVCAWTWRSFPQVVTGNVPPGYIATLHLSDDRIIVTTQTGTNQIKAGTWRLMAAYPVGDPARDNPCGLLAKEQAFGVQERPSFPVQAGPGLNCSGGSSPTGGSPTTSGKPTSADQVASLVGGNASNWRVLAGTENTGWKYEGPSATLTVPAGSRIDHPNGSSSPGQTVTTTVATLWILS